MIGQVVLLLRDLLNDHLSVQSDSQEDRVVLPDGDRLEGESFKSGAITAVLVNLEEESTLRNADPYRGVNAQGDPTAVSPEIRLSLYVLFVARFKQYDLGLQQLSSVIRYFQTHRVLDHRTTPSLDGSIEKLVVELVTLSFSEQNEVWGALRMTYHPSVLYHVRMIAFRDDEDALASVPVGESAIEISP